MKPVIVEPDHESPIQGDILYPLNPPFAEEDKTGIFLTALCDVDNDKFDYYKYALVLPADYIINKDISQIEFINSLNESQRNGNDKLTITKTKALVRKLKPFINNDGWPRFYFIPQSDGLFDIPMVIDFQAIWTTTSLNNSEIICSMQPPYVEHMLFAYSSYVGRIAVERPKSTLLKSIVEKLCTPIKPKWNNYSVDNL